MTFSVTDQKNQNDLKNELQNDPKHSKLEKLAAALISRLLGVSIAVAKSGFQHGGDAGPAGRQGRRFRLECKKYSDTTGLSDRELLGEIDQALARDIALEAWFLIATRNVSEQLRQELTQKGEREGVPVVVIDWEDRELAPLAALCAFAPDIVKTEFSEEAGKLAYALQPASVNTIEMLRRDLQSWCLGFKTLRNSSHEKLIKIWNSPKESNANLGKDAAGGAHTKRIRRSSVHQALNNWWLAPAKIDSPASVVGLDGVGKTWVTLNWLIETIDEQPIILVVPSSYAANLSSISETTVKQFLANLLYELSGVRDTAHWLRRLDYLFMRPADEGPVLTIFFDGLNQEPSIQWLPLLKILQSEFFSTKIRVIISTRKHYFENKLGSLRSLISAAASIKVDNYDTTPGSELDQMLAFEDLTQADLHPDLVKLARTPRLFALVVRFHDRLLEAGQITVHRLLWEYGRDTFGVRAGKSFSEEEWQAWLKMIAQKYRDGINDYTLKSLSESVSLPYLKESENYARLSDIIDGRFAELDSSGNLHFTSTVIEHALGVALLTHLNSVADTSFASLYTALTQWLDPIAGLDERAEILRAAVSILVEQDSKPPVQTEVLVTSWLQTQNITDDHRLELAALAPILIGALLTTIEHSENDAQASARHWAVNALKAIPRENHHAAATIFDRVTQWFKVISRDIYPHQGADFEKNRSEGFIRRIGMDQSKEITVAGVELVLVDQYDGTLQLTAPSIMEGFSLADALPIFEAAAITLAIRNRCEGWDALKWLCLLNEVDPDETSFALRELAERVRQRQPEPGINPGLPDRIATLLLVLTGQESDEMDAAMIDPRIDRWHTYEKDYLPNPGHSFFFALERRHANLALDDTESSIFWRVQRTNEFWLDPAFHPPTHFIAELEQHLASIEVNKLNRHGHYTSEDHNFEQLEHSFAQCTPNLLADMMRRKIQSIASCSAESRYWSTIHVTDHLFLADASEAVASKTLRLSGTAPDGKNEYFVANQLLMVEILKLDVKAQFDALISANLEFILDDIGQVLQPPSSENVDALITRYANESSKQKNDLLLLLSIHPIEFSDSAWSWLTGFAHQADHEFCHIAFQTLALSNAARFGQMLMKENWHWNANKHFWINHYGTGALIEATRALPFDQIAPRLAPWRLLEAVRLRSADPKETRLAAEIIGHILLAEKLSEPDPGSTLSFDRNAAKISPFTFSVTPHQSQTDTSDPSVAFGATMDDDAWIKAHRLAAKTAISRINEARTSGADLYLTIPDASDFIPALRYASNMVERWLEGYQELTPDFRRRVHLAEGTYLALCEALLSYDPPRGVKLWQSLRATISTRYLGKAGIEDSLHMIFRVSDSPEVIALRMELLGLDYSNTDQDFLNLAIAASYNDKAAWLNEMIESDRKSPLAWKRKRGVVLSGFVANSTFPIPNAWPESEIKTNHELLEMKSARFRWIEACAHHWWKAYLKANKPEDAYAAWILFLKSADPRAWIWIEQDIEATNDSSDFFKLKLSHFHLNRARLKRAMEKRIEKLDKKLFDRDIGNGIGPWH